MNCIYCLHKGTEVRNSRESKKGLFTWRRRYCPHCDKTFTTKESALADNLFVVKRNGIRQRFVYEKLFVSIFSVLNSKKGGDHGNDAKLAKRITDQLIQKAITKSDDRNIATSSLIQLAFIHLKKVDSSFADQYAYYSPYRREVASRFGLIKM